MSRFMRGEVDVLPIPLQRNENLISACPCGGIGRRVGLKIQSGFTLGASSSLAKGNFKKTFLFGKSFFYSNNNQLKLNNQIFLKNSISLDSTIY